jgi:D-sedoheptulose 7-phosphate isomerase
MEQRIKDYFNDTIKLMGAITVTIGRQAGELSQGIETACRLFQAVKKGHKKVIFIGNGGSAGIASHMAVDLWKNGGVKATAFNDSSLLTCLSNDFGYEHVFAKPIEAFADEGDLLVAISSSGNSPNILNGVAAARERGLKVITLSGFRPDNRLVSLGDLNFFVPSLEYGPVEVLHQFLCHYMLDVFIKEGER